MYEYKGTVLAVNDKGLYVVDLDFGFGNRSIQHLYLQDIVPPSLTSPINGLEYEHAKLFRKFMEAVLIDRQVIVKSRRETDTPRSMAIGCAVYSATMALYIDRNHPLHPGDNDKVYRRDFGEMLRERNLTKRQYEHNLGQLNHVIASVKTHLLDPIKRG